MDNLGNLQFHKTSSYFSNVRPQRIFFRQIQHLETQFYKTDLHIYNIPAQSLAWETGCLRSRLLKTYIRTARCCSHWYQMTDYIDIAWKKAWRSDLTAEASVAVNTVTNSVPGVENLEISVWRLILTMWNICWRSDSPDFSCFWIPWMGNTSFAWNSWQLLSSPKRRAKAVTFSPCAASISICHSFLVTDAESLSCTLILEWGSSCSQ